VRRAPTARPVELVTATDGNHGRAVAWMGRLLGLKARVFVPRVVPAEASAAIAGEGATVTVVDGPYDRAVELAAAYAAAGQGRALAQDTAWPGYERVPGWIVEGHGTLLREVDAQLAERGVPGPGPGEGERPPRPDRPNPVSLRSPNIQNTYRYCPANGQLG